METIKILLFEQPMALYWVFFFAELIVLVMLHVRRTRRWAVGAAVPIVLAGTVALLSWGVTTERERLRTALAGLTLAAQNADATGMAGWIDAAYADRRFASKGELVVAAELVARTLEVRRVVLSDVQFAVNSPRAETAFRAAVHVKDIGVGRDVVITRWRLWWVRQADGWRLTSARMEDPSGLPAAPAGP
jgi:signal transduction histidine kinase